MAKLPNHGRRHSSATPRSNPEILRVSAPASAASTIQAIAIDDETRSAGGSAKGGLAM